MKLVREKSFYKTLLAITLPIALQNLISTGVNMMDTIMLGQLGDLAISASSLANQPFFIFTLLTGGLAAGASVLTAQYWGRGDRESIRRVIAIVMRFAFVIGLAITIGVLCFPEQVMRIFTNETDVIYEGARYLRYVAFSYFFYGMTTTFLQVMRSVERVIMSLVIFGSSFFINVFFNYIFIFGQFGAPEMGVAGAAIGTLIARGCECVMALVYMLAIEKEIKFRPAYLLRFDRTLTADFVRHSMPVVVNELLWGMGTSIHAVILGHINKMVVTANSICMVLQQLSMVLILGIASSAGVMIGKTIGAGEEHKVRQYAYTIQVLSIGMGVIMAAVLVLVRDPVLSIYKIEAETAQLTNVLMLVYAVAAFFQCSIIPPIMGTLRGGGDGKFVMVVDLSTMYLIAIPLGLAAAFWLKLSPIVVIACLKSDELVKLGITLWRQKGNKWIKNLTRDRAMTA